MPRLEGEANPLPYVSPPCCIIHEWLLEEPRSLELYQPTWLADEQLAVFAALVAEGVFSRNLAPHVASD